MLITRREFVRQASAASIAAPLLTNAQIPSSSSLPLRIGMTDWNLGKRGDISKIALAREIGLDGIQVSLIFPTDDTPHLREPKTQAAFKQAALENDVRVLKYIIQNHKSPKDSNMEITFSVHGLNDAAWKTAQTTTAFSYMPYPEVQEYADIYATQDKFDAAEVQAVRDASVSLGSFLSSKKGDPDPTSAEATSIKEKIETLGGQLFYVESLMKSLDAEYKKFLSAHPA